MSFENVPALSNRSERLPCVLVVDASSSMSGEPIAELNKGLQDLAKDLRGDDNAKRCVRLMIVEVSGVLPGVIVEWTDAERFEPPTLIASGSTPLGGGVQIALTNIRSEIAFLRSQGIARKKPWLWIFTDGAPNEGWEGAAAECRAAHAAGDVLVYPVAVGADADVAKLGAFTKDNKVYQIRGADFKKIFEFISSSAKAGSAQPGVTEVTPLFNQIAVK